MTPDADDKKPNRYDPYDGTIDDQSMQLTIRVGLSLLERPQSYEEWADILSKLVPLVRSMDESEEAKLIVAIKRGPKKRGRGSPKKSDRLHQIESSIPWYSLKLDGTAHPGLGRPKRGKRITEIAAFYKITSDAAGKAYDQAMMPLKDAKKARKVVANKTGK